MNRDINNATHVEIRIDQKGDRIWINVNGVCEMRLFQVEEINIEKIGEE